VTVAVDTNILLDLVSTDTKHFEASSQRLDEASRVDEVIVGEIAYAELAPHFADEEGAGLFLSGLGIVLRRSSPAALEAAGRAFKAYLKSRQPQTCPSCGAILPGRERILPDFMIGAHALVHAGRLLTRDRGYYATYFPDLVLV
jgi:predicted nucleic acid-binding protein